MRIRFKPSFVRDFKKLPSGVQEAAYEKIAAFETDPSHPSLRTHKLQGKLKDFYSFSITYSHRVIFSYETKDIVVFLAIGTHDVYK